MSTFLEKFGTMMLSAFGFSVWIAWLNLFISYKWIYTIDFTDWTLGETWSFVAINQTWVWASTAIIIYISASYFQDEQVNKGNLAQMYVKKTLNILLSNWSDPLACMACEILFNAILRCFGTNLDVLWTFIFTLCFFIFSLVLSYGTEKFLDLQNHGRKTMTLYSHLFVASLFGNLNWFNAIALKDTVRAILDDLFPQDLWVQWVEYIIIFIICSGIVFAVNYSVKSDNNDIRSALGLHVQMAYVVILTFMGAQLRDVVILSLQNGDPDTTINTVSFLLVAIFITVLCFIFQHLISKWSDTYSNDGKKDAHDVFGELLENYNKYLFGWFLAQFWNKFFLSAFADDLGENWQKAVYAIVWTCVLAAYSILIHSVIKKKYFKKMKGKLIDHMISLKHTNETSLNEEQDVEHYSKMFKHLMSDHGQDKTS